MLVIERRGETRPAGAALEFLFRQEQRQPAEAAREHPIAMLVEEAAAEGRLGPVSKQHIAFFGREIRLEARPLIERRRREIEACG